MKNMLQKSMNSLDELVVEFSYEDRKGNRTRRVVSPIRFLGNNRFLALCLSREEPRQFYFDRCHQMMIRPAWDYVMPVALVTEPTLAE